MDSIVDRALIEIRQKKEKEMQRMKRLKTFTINFTEKHGHFLLQHMLYK